MGQTEQVMMQTASNAYLSRKENQREQLREIQDRVKYIKNRLFGNDSPTPLPTSNKSDKELQECFANSLLFDADCTDFIIDSLRESLNSIEQ